MNKKTIAIVGHSLAPPRIEPVEGADIHIYRSPGGKVASFENDSKLNGVLTSSYDLVIIFLGGNDVHNNCNPSQITDNIKGVIEQVRTHCNSHIAFVLLEHRSPKQGNRFNIDEDQYNRVANSINNRLKRSYKNKSYVQFLSISAKPFQNGVTDGIHFNRETKLHLERKLRNTIMRFVNSQ